MDARGFFFFLLFGSMMNNLIWPDPYGDGSSLVGDVADRWEVTDSGKVITFSLRKGITFQDGTSLTSRDVAYNFDRGWKPRSPTMTYFKVPFQLIQQIETPDDLTVRVTMSQPSNAFLRVVSTNSFLMYPAAQPFPEKLDQWKANPVGTGPFKFKSITPGVKLEVVRNDAYWKAGLPYLDGIVYNVLTPDASVAAFRTGRLDAANLDTAIIDQLSNDVRRDIQFTSYPVTVSIPVTLINRKEPFLDARVRQAVSLAMDRQAAANVWLQGRGSPYAAPLIPPELGGQWGISTEVTKARPGYREGKAQDLARAKELIAQAGVDPTKFAIQINGNSSFPQQGEILERDVSALGFKTNLVIVPQAETTGRLLNGQFDIAADNINISFDDPLDYLAPSIATGGGKNYGKWSNPKIDALLAEQDATQDVAKRKQVLLELQETILTDATVIPTVLRRSDMGHLPWVKNYPSKLPVLFSSFYRWEQVYLTR